MALMWTDDELATALCSTRRALRKVHGPNYERLVSPLREIVRAACHRHGVGPIQALIGFERAGLNPTFTERAALVSAALDVLDETTETVH